jgi:UDP-N-acetylmuramate-alanine ligase
VRLVKALEDLPAAVAAIAKPNDLVITLGAGSIGSIPDRILEELGGRSPAEAAGEGGAR